MKPDNTPLLFPSLPDHTPPPDVEEVRMDYWQKKEILIGRLIEDTAHDFVGLTDLFEIAELLRQFRKDLDEY